MFHSKIKHTTKEKLLRRGLFIHIKKKLEKQIHWNKLISREMKKGISLRTNDEQLNFKMQMSCCDAF